MAPVFAGWREFLAELPDRDFGLFVFIFFFYIFISSHPREGEPKLGLTEPAISLLSEPKGSSILQYAALLEEKTIFKQKKYT